jgi:competence protein ComEA
MQAIKQWVLSLSAVNRIVIVALGALVVFLIGSSFSQQNSSYEFAIEDIDQPVSESKLGRIYVHIAGEVNNPGLYELEAGARVEEALELAGGMTDQAFEQSVNLARMVSDGEQIVVLAKGQIASGATSGFISLNNADQEQLESLPGVGPALAQAILEYRNRVGSFSDLAQLREVSGIGSKLYAKITPQLSL